MPRTSKLVVATRNAGKLKELTVLLSGVPMQLVTLDEIGVEGDVDEAGATLEQNAVLKATTYSLMSGRPVLADDSGLEVEALGGEPGPRSARYAGDGATDAERVAFLLDKLKDKPDDRLAARFRCVIAVSWPNEPVETYSGECHGVIVREPRGSNGFGYDPIFFIPEMGKTMAELTSEEKDRISHRAMAARKAAEALSRRGLRTGRA